MQNSLHVTVLVKFSETAAMFILTRSVEAVYCPRAYTARTIDNHNTERGLNFSLEVARTCYITVRTLLENSTNVHVVMLCTLSKEQTVGMLTPL
jgi:hypothetical protein